MNFYVALTHESSDQNGYLWAPDAQIVSIWWQQDIYQEDKLKLVSVKCSDTRHMAIFFIQKATTLVLHMQDELKRQNGKGLPGQPWH